MPYYDESGKIMIDEDAAMVDISTLQSAKDELEATKNEITEIIGKNSAFTGVVADTISQSSEGVLKRINDELERIESLKKTIELTVNKYKEIDRQMKQRIESSI